MSKQKKSIKTICKEKVTPSAINTIRFLFNSPKTKGKTIVLIEGSTDKKVYSFLFNLEKVYLHVLGSCNSIEEILKNLNTKYKDEFFAIKDADFDWLNKKNYKYSNLFITDTHDLETMMVLSIPEINKRLCCDFFEGKNKNIISKVIKDLKYLSLIKWFNSFYNFCLDVNCININLIYDGKKQVKAEQCIEKLYRKQSNEKKCPDILKKLRTFIKEKYQNEYLFNLKLVNGHDLFIAIAIYIRNYIKKNINEEIVSQFCRAAYTLQYFRKTKMYRSIKKWAQLNNKTLF